MLSRAKFDRIQAHFRRKRFELLENLIRSVLAEREIVRILDIGGRGEYWEKLSEDLHDKVHITCVNFEDELETFKSSKPGLQIEMCVGDGCAMPQYADGQFDIAHSNSVIEHVGLVGDMVRFAEETKRIGRAYYVQTPNFWFVLDPHYCFPFLHWFPEQFRMWVFTKMKVGYAKKCTFERALFRVDHTRMIGAWTLRHLFEDGRMTKERLGPFAKSMTVIRDYR